MLRGTLSSRLSIMNRLRPATAVLTVVLAGAMLSACGDKADSSGDTSGATSSSAGAGDLTKATYFRTVTAAQQQAKSAHMIASIGAAGRTIKASGDVLVGKDLADNAATMTMDMAGTGLGTLKMVLVDGSFYLNFGQVTHNKYAKVDLTDKNNPLSKEFGHLLDQMDPSAQFKQFKVALKSLDKKGSPESIDGVRAQPYVLVLDSSKIAAFADLPSSTAKSIPATLTYTMYIGPDNLMRRITYNIAGSSSQIDYTNWGDPVDISAPAPADVSDQDLSGLFGGVAAAA